MKNDSNLSLKDKIAQATYQGRANLTSSTLGIAQEFKEPRNPKIPDKYVVRLAGVMAIVFMILFVSMGSGHHGPPSHDSAQQKTAWVIHRLDHLYPNITATTQVPSLGTPSQATPGGTSQPTTSSPAGTVFPSEASPEKAALIACTQVGYLSPQVVGEDAIGANVVVYVTASSASSSPLAGQVDVTQLSNGQYQATFLNITGRANLSSNPTSPASAKPSGSN